MCGLLGEFTFQNYAITEAPTFEGLLALSKHRGPDATLVVRGNGFQLGFNRLSILDVSALGNQPKQSPSGRYQVVFNGEIYNYKELIKAYDLTNLKSSSDTEVLIHMLDKVGIQTTISLLNGMFGITILDTNEDCLYLTRDFAGIKPLFYGVATEGIAIASQFDQVFKHPWFRHSLALRPEIVKEYFGFGYMQAPNTIYKSIFQVEPGKMIRVERSGKLAKTTLVSFKKNQGPRVIGTKLSAILKTAVSKQLVSDVPIATFLSGGIDSPLISAYAKKHVFDIEAFTLEVDDQILNESRIAQDYASHLNIKQHIVSVQEADLVSEIDAHFKAYSEPFGDYSSIPTYVISKEAKKQFTVMLSGDGGDELFFGYPRMLDVLQKRLWFKLPYAVRKNLARFTNKLGLTKSWAPYFENFDAFIANKHLKLPTLILKTAFPNTSFSKGMCDLYSFKNGSTKNLLNQLRWNEFYAHLQRVLVKVDRASMAHSLEVRVPFLDKDVITWAWQQKGNLNGEHDLKKDLKALLGDCVPENLINNKKMGFSVPLYEWLHKALKKDIIRIVFETPYYGEDIIDITVLRDYVQDFFDKKHNNAWGVWHIYAWQKWWLAHGLKN